MTSSRPTDPELTVIIVSFNTRDLTVACVRSILSQTDHVKFEIIVIDNNSRDGSAVTIETEFPDIKLIKLNENVGFARANNLAALKAKGKRLLLLNPDTLIIDDGIERLQNFANLNPEGGIWGGRTLTSDGKLDPTCVWRKIGLWSIFCITFGLSAAFPKCPAFNVEGYGGWKRNAVRKVDIITGCFLLIDRGLWVRLGGFDPRFFMYGEEADLCLRAQRLGAYALFTPDAAVVHLGGAAESSDVRKTFFLFCARATLVNQQLSPLKREIARGLLLLHVLLRCFFFHIANLLDGRFQARRSLWAKLWKNRKRWLVGYQNRNHS